MLLPNWRSSGSPLGPSFVGLQDELYSKKEFRVQGLGFRVNFFRGVQKSAKFRFVTVCIPSSTQSPVLVISA